MTIYELEAQDSISDIFFKVISFVGGFFLPILEINKPNKIITNALNWTWEGDSPLRK